MAKKSCVLAYSGGLDTSVILGWLMDRGYDVHCVYVDVGQPCEDRAAIRKKAEDIPQPFSRVYYIFFLRYYISFSLSCFIRRK